MNQKPFLAPALKNAAAAQVKGLNAAAETADKFASLSGRRKIEMASLFCTNISICKEHFSNNSRLKIFDQDLSLSYARVEKVDLDLSSVGIWINFSLISIYSKRNTDWIF